MKLMVDMKLEVDVPEEYCESSLKEWVWREHKDQLFEAMKFEEVHNPSPTHHDINQRLQLLDTISQVQRQYLQNEEASVVFGVLLESLLDLMNSEYGFIGEIKYEPDGTMYLHNYSTTNIAWNDETRAFYDANVATGLKFYNLNTLFGRVMTTKEVVISNNPKEDPYAFGIPKGHPPLNHFLGIPFFHQGCADIVGMVGIANKPGGYTEEDVEFLEPFVVTCSNLIRAYHAIQENKRLINNLEEKVAERTVELSQANDRLEAANRRVVAASAAQLTHFACMSHEIRTPLNCIIGLSSLLQESELSHKQNDSLRMIINSGELLCTVVNDILDYSKIQSGNVVVDIRRTNLQETLDSVVKSFEHKARSKKLGFKTMYSPSVPQFVDTDSNRLQQILYNLLGNAVKFSDEGGSVELAVDVVFPGQGDPTSPESTYCEVQAEMPSAASKCPFQHQLGATVTSDLGPPTSCPFARSTASKNESPIVPEVRESLPCGILRFTIKDYGRGIDPKDYGRIFEPFSQANGDTERLYGGTGLGLAITAKLVERLGGTIRVESELGKWSTFTVDMPSVTSQPDMSRLLDSLKNARILYVDRPNECNERVINNLELPVERFDSCWDLYDWCIEETKSVRANSEFHICLVQEDLYSHDIYRRFAESTPSTLVTFGPHHRAIVESRAHFRSISELLPCVLMQSLADIRNEIHERAGNVRRRPRPDILTQVDVLIVEDNLINQKVLSKMLERLGVGRVDIANNGQEAVDRAVGYHYDVIFMDMQMPIMDGEEACRVICEYYRELDIRRPKIVFVSAHVSSTWETKAFDAGADGFISKPFNAKKFEDYVRSLEL